jgi:N-acetylglucosaminyldiphosphoundecaprenol N-acetyl-beta-D-mannosaminyltransferase
MRYGEEVNPDSPAIPGLPPSSATADILGLRVQSRSMDDVNEAIGAIVRAGGHSVIPNVNIHFANLAVRLPWLRDFFNRAAVNFCDGVGIQLAARILGQRIPHRFTPPDWMDSLAAFCAVRAIRVFFLGGRPGVAAAAAAALTSRHPGLAIVGAHHGHFDHSTRGDENLAVIAAINRSRPDVLMVAMGMPLQEQWLACNWERLDARVALTGGALFDYLAGRVRRPPAWLRRCSGEWLGRLLIEPRRLWRRYLIGNPLFILRVIRQSLGSGR